MQPSTLPASFVASWREKLKATQEDQIDDFPSYHVFDPDALLGNGILKDFYVGTGLSIFARALLPAILEARRSIDFVTCYWAESPSLDAFKETLEQLARARKDAGMAQTLRITIGFSSRGLLQKLFHTGSRDGYLYPPAKWPELGLPEEGVLRDARIDMTVKSLFFTPFSVMHSKYLIVDGEKAWIPSCNVSWERWLEGCIAVEGNIVRKLVIFHEKVWASGARSAFRGDDDGMLEEEEPLVSPRHQAAIRPHDSKLATQSYMFQGNQPVPTIFLPSPHHRNPRFSVFPLLSHTQPPMTPLNAALLTLFETAQSQITVLTPNVTSWPALDALLVALSRGVDVQIITSKDMMFVEQLVTAGTWTSRCLHQFIQKYERLVGVKRRSGNVEAGSVKPGCLEILLYKEASSRKGQADEPVVSHFKATMVDRSFVLLGSGNMDRASWWTSQEIGVLFYIPGFEGSTVWESVLEPRTDVLYSSQGM